jgi:predicted RNase H-like HicB family nuclease
MSEIVFLLEDDSEGGYVARALGHAIITDGATLDEVRVNVRDAVRCHFEEADRPAVIRLHYVKDEVLAA